MSKVKKLNKTNINKLDKSLSKMKKIQVEAEGDKFEVQVKEKFTNPEIEKCIQYITDVQGQSETLTGEKQPVPWQTLFFLGLIKHFTDVPFDEENSALEDMQVFTVLAKAGIVEQIIQEIPDSEMDKFNKAVDKMAENLPNMIKSVEDMVKNVSRYEHLLDDNKGKVDVSDNVKNH